MHFRTVFIGVNYNTPNQTVEWIDSIKTTNPESLVVVVDNSPEKEPELKILIEKKAIYIAAPENLGYFNGAAYGLHKIEETYTFDWVAVTNVDLKLQTKSVSTILEKYEGCGVIAPGIISYDTGFDKNPYRIRRPSKRSVQIKRVAFSNSVFSGLYSFFSNARNKSITKKHIEKKKCSEGTRIYLPYGAAIIFSAKYFKEGCVIDYPLFLFGEELYVAEQAKKANLDIVYVPSIEFINFEHASTSKLNKNAIRKRNHDAMKYILENYYK